MNDTIRYTIHFWLYAALVITVDAALAEPKIDIKFKNDQVTGEELIQAKANCDVKKKQAYKAFKAIIEYPDLHLWIQNTEDETEESNGYQTFLIEFDFPWPVGKQWSRVKVSTNNSVISWNQIEGTLNINRGRIAIIEHDDQAYVDYQAVLDLGYPDAFTRDYKEQFVTEFLIEIYNRMNNKNQLPVETVDNLTEQTHVVSAM